MFLAHVLDLAHVFVPFFDCLTQVVFCIPGPIRSRCEKSHSGRPRTCRFPFKYWLVVNLSLLGTNVASLYCPHSRCCFRARRKILAAIDTNSRELASKLFKRPLKIRVECFHVLTSSWSTIITGRWSTTEWSGKVPWFRSS